MRILLVSDVPDPKYWDYYKEGDLDDIDLILSMGDLPPQYLSFLVTFAKCPLYYVHGNHDDCYDTTPPEGCECIDDKIIRYKGLRIMGLGGCMRYKPGKYQYTESEMSRRIRRMRGKLMRSRGIDILVTHAPAAGQGDGEDHVHQGYQSLLWLLVKYRPRYHFFGHQHLNYGRKQQREFDYGETHMVNATKSVIIEIEEANT